MTSSEGSVKARWVGLLGEAHRRTVMGRRIRRLASALAEIIPENLRILDVGAGNGYLASTIMDMRPDLNIEGIDIKLWPRRHISVHKFDGTSIPFDDDSWDACLASDVIHHSDEPKLLLGEMVRVARSSVFLKDHVAETAWDLRMLSFMDWAGNRGHDVVLSYRYWSWDEWSEVFDNLGLQTSRVETKLNLYPLPFRWIFDRKLHFVAKLDLSR